MFKTIALKNMNEETRTDKILNEGTVTETLQIRTEQKLN